MSKVRSAPGAHPGPLERESSQDELDKELDRLIEGDSDGSPRSEDRSPRNQQQNSSNNKSSANEQQKRDENLRKMDTHYPRTPSPRSSSTGSPPPASPGRQDYMEDEHFEEDDDIEDNGPQSVNDSNGKGTSNGDTVDDDDDQYGDQLDYDNMSEGQKQAMMELQNMKLDLAYTADEEPPEYDVTERVRQLNEELAKEPSPKEDDRERAIKFQENPVSLVVPPPDYIESEEEENNQNKTEEKKNMDVEEEQQQQESVAQSPKDSPIQSPRDTETNKTVTKESTKTEIGDVLDSDDEHHSDKEDVHSRSSSVHSDNSMKQTSVNDSSNSGKQRPKSGAPAGAKKRQVKTKDTDEESNSSREDNTKKSDTSGDDEGEKVLVERNGEFELLKASDLTAEERQFYGVETEEDRKELEDKQEKDDDEDKAESVHSSASSSSSSKEQHKPHPPSKPRPQTATTPSNRQHANQRRVKSAKQTSSNNDTDYDFYYVSPYKLSPRAKKEIQKEHNEKMKKQKEEEDKEKERKHRDQEEAEEAFDAWLAKKKQDAAKRREDDNKRKKEEKEEQEKNNGSDDKSDNSAKTDPESAYKEWCGVKKDQQKRKKKEQEAQRREYESVHVSRPRNECNKAFRDTSDDTSTNENHPNLKPDPPSPSEQAFKEWLKKKNADLKRKQLEEKQQNRVYRLMSRKSRKSQQLARAMAHAQTFKYVDYYGYRF